MANGYTGKILRLNLTSREISTLDTSKYEQWVGGHGMGTAIFWDLCQDKTVDGFNPGNVVTIMSSPLTGTLTPSASRGVISGIGVHTYPTAWYTQSHFGGPFTLQMKLAGWDGIVVEGKAENPVWISIINDSVTINDASGKGDAIWGLTASAAQEAVWAKMTKKHQYPGWLAAGNGLTTQKPAVLCTGPAGEKLGRVATLTATGGSAAGQGGFGGVFGGKNLKAIGVLGTGSIPVADPKAVMQARMAFQKTRYNVDNPIEAFKGNKPGNASDPPVSVVASNHVTGCPSCIQPCRRRYSNGACNEATCGTVHWYITATEDEVIYDSIDLANEYGLNISDTSIDDSMQYILKLYKEGILGPGKQIDSAPLPMEEILNGTMAGADAYMRAIANREGIGNDLAEGLMRAAQKWGTAQKDLETGRLCMPGYGIMYHHWLPSVYWAYGSILSERDINETSVQTFPYAKLSAEDAVKVYTAKLSPYNDPYMMNFAWQGADGSNMAEAKATGIYSDSKAKLVAWERAFEKFWKSSALFCKRLGPDWFADSPDYPQGFSPDMELGFYNAVTGRNITFNDSIELGRKIFNLDRAIWAMQGRTREVEVFAPWMYKPGTGEGEVPPAAAEGQNRTRKDAGVWNGTSWSYQNVTDLFIDRDAFEEWKTKFYKLEGWDTATGRPTRQTLEALGMKNVADELEAKGKLGKSA
jgi:aldehyde:ferredoxin oxidoreductase